MKRLKKFIIAAFIILFMGQNFLSAEEKWPDAFKKIKFYQKGNEIEIKNFFENNTIKSCYNFIKKAYQNGNKLYLATAVTGMGLLEYDKITQDMIPLYDLNKRIFQQLPWIIISRSGEGQDLFFMVYKKNDLCYIMMMHLLFLGFTWKSGINKIWR